MTASQGTEPASKTLEHGLDVLLCFLGERRELSLTEIAAIVGYEDPLYFSRVFRKARGLSPMKYRRAYREGF